MSKKSGLFVLLLLFFLILQCIRSNLLGQPLSSSTACPFHQMHVVLFWNDAVKYRCSVVHLKVLLEHAIVCKTYKKHCSTETAYGGLT